MSDLAAWLLAQIAEDERVCHLGQPYASNADRFPDDMPDTAQAWAKLAEMEETHTLAIHTAKCGYSMLEEGGDCDCGVPVRVLAECAAKRGIVEGAGKVLDAEAWEYDDAPYLAARVLWLLAAPFADRPGYDPAWKVET